MKNFLFSVYDCKSNLWSEPLMAVNEVSMKRYIYTKYSQNPLFAKDLYLYNIGQFDIEGYHFTKDDFDENGSKLAIKGYSVGDLDNPVLELAASLVGNVKDILDEISKELKEGSVDPEENV